MVVIMKILQVILALSILILIHEFGHFIFAKMFGIRVDKFYLFFDVGEFRLFSTRNNKFIKKYFPKLAESETDYGIGWLPLGGYCKIAGMVDESMDLESLKSEPEPYEFRTKPAWQRLLVMAGGVLFNFILAICLYISILAIWGKTYLGNKGNEIYVNELAYDMGFRNGDRILKFDDYEPENFYMLQADMARMEAGKAVVLRDGDTVTLWLDHSRISEILNTPGMFDLAVPFIVDSIPPASPNYGCELRRGDRILSFDGVCVPYVQDSWAYLGENKGKTVSTLVERLGDTLNLDLQVDTTGRLGIYMKTPELTRKDFGLLEAIPAGFNLTFETIGGYLQDLKLVFKPSTKAYKSVGSFIAIGQVFPSSWDWYRFINILALLSIMLGVMNLLPIPALDGGHIMFTLYEMITGRKPSDKFLEIMQVIGMIFIFGLMFLAFGNDIARLLK